MLLENKNWLEAEGDDVESNHDTITISHPVSALPVRSNDSVEPRPLLANTGNTPIRINGATN